MRRNFGFYWNGLWHTPKMEMVDSSEESVMSCQKSCQSDNRTVCVIMWFAKQTWITPLCRQWKEITKFLDRNVAVIDLIQYAVNFFVLFISTSFPNLWPLLHFRGVSWISLRYSFLLYSVHNTWTYTQIFRHLLLGELWLSRWNTLHLTPDFPLKRMAVFFYELFMFMPYNRKY
jgi:hypothetical protein